MSKLDELKGKAKAVVENIKDSVEEKAEEFDRKSDEAKGYAEVRKPKL
jgi:uncharacterized protein YjbJ (UPF0337 family)